MVQSILGILRLRARAYASERFQWRCAQDDRLETSLAAKMKRAAQKRRLKSESKSLLGFLFLWLGDGDGFAHITHFEAGEAAHEDVLPQFADLAGDQLVDRDARLFHEGLIEPSDFFLELLHLPFPPLLHPFARLPRGPSLLP